MQVKLNSSTCIQLITSSGTSQNFRIIDNFFVYRVFKVKIKVWFQSDFFLLEHYDIINDLFNICPVVYVFKGINGFLHATETQCGSVLAEWNKLNKICYLFKIVTKMLKINYIKLGIWLQAIFTIQKESIHRMIP